MLVSANGLRYQLVTTKFHNCRAQAFTATMMELFDEPDLPSSAFPVMESLRNRGELCDVIIMVEGRNIAAHKLVLAATIPYFQAMFCGEMIESSQNEVEMKGIDADSLTLLIDYAYSGKITITETNVQTLLVAASYLNLIRVKQAASNFIKKRIHHTNAIEIRHFATQFACQDLVSAVDKCIHMYFNEVCKSDEFLKLEKHDVANILARDELHVKNEEQIFDALLVWIQYDLDNRRQYLADLLIHVRLPLMRPEFLADAVGKNELIRTDLRCRDLVDEAKDYLLLPDRRLASTVSFRTRPRCCIDVLGIMYAVGGLNQSGNSLSTVERYDVVSNRWELCVPMNSLRSRVGVTVLQGQLYAIGGYDGTDRLNTVEVYNPATRRWASTQPMNSRRSALGSVTLGDKIYVCGGYDGTTSLCSVEVFEPQNNGKWTNMASMLRHRSAAGVTTLGPCIYVAGGHDGLSIFDSVEKYDPQAGFWDYVTPMKTRRCRLGLAALKGKLFAAGGYDGSHFLDTVETFDPATNQWRHVARMNVKRSRVSLVANGGKLYAVGGYDGCRNLNSVECYDPSSNQWTLVLPMIAHEGGVGIGVVLPLDCEDND